MKCVCVSMFAKGRKNMTFKRTNIYMKMSLNKDVHFTLRSDINLEGLIC